MIKQRIKLIGELPPYFKISDMLWGAGADVDSDGNSKSPNSTNWNELTLILRNDINQRVDIDPDQNDDNYLVVKSEVETLVAKTVNYLLKCGAAE